MRGRPLRPVGPGRTPPCSGSGPHPCEGAVPTASLQSTWDAHAPSIDSEQYLIGFSFYEENDDWNEWNDTSEPFEESRAVAFADWQPDGVAKGGIFSYAVDRDGAAFKDDEIHHTTYEWSKRLKHRMLDQA